MHHHRQAARMDNREQDLRGVLMLPASSVLHQWAFADAVVWLDDSCWNTALERLHHGLAASLCRCVTRLT
jgi:hypothetical protein